MDEAMREVQALRERLARLDELLAPAPRKAGPDMNQWIRRTAGRGAPAPRTAPAPPEAPGSDGTDLEARRGAILAAATRRRFRNPELAVRLLQADAGEPDDLVDQLTRAEPYLVAPREAPDMNLLIRRAAGHAPEPPPSEEA